jgi:large subunit ribosomal protein L25
MDIATLVVEKRDPRGTRAARRLRDEGKLPGIIYGHGQTPEAVAVPRHELSTLLEHGAHVLELSFGDARRQVLIKDVQRGPINAEPVHVDFALVDLSERVEVTVPIDYKGTPAGTKQGGIFEQYLVDLAVECKVSEIPANVRVVVDELQLGQSLHVSELQLPEGIVAVTPADTIVCAVHAKAAEVEAVVAVEGEAEVEPEIIKRKKEEEESAAE